MSATPITSPAQGLRSSPTSTVFRRFAGYLSGDALNYLLGFAIYGYLIRMLSNGQYGQLSVASSIYQVLMMVAALGLDLIGPRLLADASANPIAMVRTLQRYRLLVTLVVCGPATAIGAWWFVHLGQRDTATVLAAGFSMVLARAFDVTYLAVTLARPAALARSRFLGLGLYFVALVLCSRQIAHHLWIIPLVNALGVTVGRIQLLSALKRCSGNLNFGHQVRLPMRRILAKGLKAGSGQIVLLVFQTMDVVILDRFVAGDVLGQFAMISRLYLLGTAVLTALLNTFLPELTKVATEYRLLRREFRRFLIWSRIIGILGAIAFARIAPAVCELLSHRSLPTVWRVAPYYAITFLLLAIGNPYTSLLPALHCEARYLVVIVISAAVVVTSNLLLAPGFGAQGSALAQLIGTAVLGLLSAAVYLSYVRRLQHRSSWGAAGAQP